jgi:hypothetical protein
MNLIFQKVTLFLILGITVIAICIPVAFYYSRRDVTGMSMGALLVIALIAALVLILDRVVVRFVSPLSLSIIELGLLIGGLVIYTYNSRTRILDLSANPAAYFVIIWTKDGSESPVFERRFPLDQVATVTSGNVVLLDKKTFMETEVKLPSQWGGQFSRGIELDHPRFESAYYYGKEEDLGKKAEVDSLLRQTVNQQLPK